VTAPAVAAQPEAAVQFYERTQRIVAAALVALRSRFPEFRASAIDASFAVLLPDLVTVLSAMQLLVVRNATLYVPQVLDELAIDAPAVAEVVPSAFVGASSGVPLETLFGTVPEQAKVWSGQGASLDDIESRAGSLLDGIFETQLADTSRSAMRVGITARPQVTGFVRMVSGGACGRCIVLAGRFYRYNADFLRHPRCHCYGVPSTREASRGVGESPEAMFSRLSSQQQDRSFGKANAQAIRDGADMSRVVNATGRRSGMTTTTGDGVKLTYEGTRATAGKLRLTPEAIYRFATDRQDAIGLLKAQGYLA
jgi:hypothetical protein